MKAVMFILALVQLGAGIFFWANSVSAIHETVAAICFGFGSVCLGLGALINSSNA